MIKLIATDMDGTLLNSNIQIQEVFISSFFSKILYIMFTYL